MKFHLNSAVDIHQTCRDTEVPFIIIPFPITLSLSVPKKKYFHGLEAHSKGEAAPGEVVVRTRPIRSSNCLRSRMQVYFDVHPVFTPCAESIRHPDKSRRLYKILFECVALQAELVPGVCSGFSLFLHCSFLLNSLDFFLVFASKNSLSLIEPVDRACPGFRRCFEVPEKL